MKQAQVNPEFAVAILAEAILLDLIRLTDLS